MRWRSFRRLRGGEVITVRVQAARFDVGVETGLLGAACGEAGAVASFLGVVRSTVARPIVGLELEHYPGMTERSLGRIAGEAVGRFGLLGCTVVHRVGVLAPGEGIVLVLAAAGHRRAALDGVGFLIDWLKTDAPFWKREHLTDGRRVWVEARAADAAAAAGWSGGGDAGGVG